MTILSRTPIFALGHMLRASGAGRVGECSLRPSYLCVRGDRARVSHRQSMLRTLDDVARLFERQSQQAVLHVLIEISLEDGFMDMLHFGMHA